MGLSLRDTQRWHIYRVSVSFVAGYCSPVFVPTMFRPLSCSPEATTQHPLRVIRWSHNAYITHYYAAAALIPERLRWNIARAGNCLPLACALLFRLLSFGSGASTSRRQVCLTDLYRATDGRDILHCTPLTRRAISGGIGKHSKPPPNMRRRTMHSIAGAFV